MYLLSLLNKKNNTKYFFIIIYRESELLTRVIKKILNKKY